MRYYLSILAGLAALLLTLDAAASDGIDELTDEVVTGPLHWDPIITRFTVEPRGDSETVSPIEVGEKKNNGKAYANLLGAWEPLKKQVRVRRDEFRKPVAFSPFDPTDVVV